jgi:hypothetical protein
MKFKYAYLIAVMMEDPEPPMIFAFQYHRLVMQEVLLRHYLDHQVLVTEQWKTVAHYQGLMSNAWSPWYSDHSPK